MWTRQRLHEAGYTVDAGCTKCCGMLGDEEGGSGGLPRNLDDTFHRLWECQGSDVVEARTRALGPKGGSVVERARRASRGSLLFTRGWLPFCPSEWARPAEDNEVRCVAVEAAGWG